MKTQILIGLLIALGFSPMVEAYSGPSEQRFRACMVDVKEDCLSWAVSGGGSEAPRGLTVESRAELAVGEKYILTGRIEIRQNQPFLLISFQQQAWLASAKRVADPYYRIADVASNWKRFQGREVSIVVKPVYFVWNRSGKPRVEIHLEPSTDLVLNALQFRNN